MELFWFSGGAIGSGAAWMGVRLTSGFALIWDNVTGLKSAWMGHHVREIGLVIVIRAAWMGARCVVRLDCC